MEKSPNKKRELSQEEIQDAQIGLLEWEIEELGADHLTGLKTRKAFTETLDNAIKAMQREKELRAHSEPLRELSVLFIDLDNFKHVNDEYDHTEGDKALIEAARSISSSIRHGQDTAGRFGGDEFYVLLPRTKRDGAREVAEKIINTIRTNELLSKYKVTASVGAYCATSGNSSDLTADYVIKRADQAQFRAKQEGKNTLVIDGAE